MKVTRDWDALRTAAENVAARAYAPYSKFQVGAALLAADGRVFCGCNVENASYGLTICAERSAVFSAVAAGTRSFLALAVTTSSVQPVTPCGACRQVLLEFAPELRVRCYGLDGRVLETRTSTLLPHAFVSEAFREPAELLPLNSRSGRRPSSKVASARLRDRARRRARARGNA